MRIVFMGASELGWVCCRALFELGQEVVGIFSIPKKFRISWSSQPVTNVRYRSMEDLAQAHSIPLVYITKKMSDPEYKNILQQMQPDLLVVIGWYYMVPRSLREIAPLGAVGIHASLLPKYRGGAPLVWTIINGETQGGVSLFHLADGVDDGDLIGQIGFDIGLEEDIADVIRKATNASVQLVREYIPRLAAGNAPRIPQDHALATVVPPRKPEDGLLDWTTKSALQAYNWVRAQTRPYPGAFTYLLGKKVTLYKASLSEVVCGKDVFPGEILPTVPDAPDALGVWCADNRLLRVHEVEVDGVGVSGREFLAMLVSRMDCRDRLLRFTTSCAEL